MAPWVLLGVAQAGELELAVERGWVAVSLEQFASAREQALAVLAREPGHAPARDLYVEASAGAGWGSVGALELAGEAIVPGEIERWEAFRREVEAHVAAADKAALKADLARLPAEFPDAPDLVLPLFAVDEGPAVSLRSSWVSKAEPATWTEEAALRWRRLASAVDAPRVHQAVSERLAALGVSLPPRPPLDHPGMYALGQTWSETDAKDPFFYPSELAVAGGHLDQIWTKAARWDDLVAFWSAVDARRIDGAAPVRLAAAHLAAGRPEVARESADAGFVATGAPRETDRLVGSKDRLAADFSAALRTRAAVALAAGDVPTARGDLGTSILLAEAVTDAKLADKIAGLVSAYEGPLEAKYVSRTATPAQVAVGRAIADAKDPAKAEAALITARDARLLAFSGTAQGRALAEDPSAWAQTVGDTWYAEGTALSALGRHAPARSALVVASLLLPRDPEVWAARSAAHEALGEREAAFFASAIARGLGVPALDERLAALYAGPGGWQVVADALGGPPPAAPVAARPRGVPTVVGTSGGGRKPASGGGPRLGEPFPDLALEDVSIGELRGRVLVVSAFRSDCVDCLQMLPSYARMALRLRPQGVDVVVVPISVDTDDELYRKTAIFARNWGQLGRDPNWVQTLGLRRYPTTWLVDRTGTTRFFVDHWMSAAELESLVRQMP